MVVHRKLVAVGVGSLRSPWNYSKQILGEFILAYIFILFEESVFKRGKQQKSHLSNEIDIFPWTWNNMSNQIEIQKTHPPHMIGNQGPKNMPMLKSLIVKTCRNKHGILSTCKWKIHIDQLPTPTTYNMVFRGLPSTLFPGRWHGNKMDIVWLHWNMDKIFTRTPCHSICNDRRWVPTVSAPRYEIHHVGIHGAECRTRRGAVVTMTVALLYHMVAEVLVVAGKPWKLWMSGEQCHTF